MEGPFIACDLEKYANILQIIVVYCSGCHVLTDCKYHKKFHLLYVLRS